MIHIKSALHVRAMILIIKKDINYKDRWAPRLTLNDFNFRKSTAMELNTISINLPYFFNVVSLNFGKFHCSRPQL